MPNTPTLDAFVQQIGPVAQQLGITTLIIIGRDPQTGELKLFGESAAKAAPSDLRVLVEDKFGFSAEAVWNDT
jgi:hypothetical protein